MSKFRFIRDEVLRENLDVTFKHILDLVSSLDDKKYNKVSKSSFCKTIIIHTASIIEALLFCILKNNFSENDLTENVWKFEYSKKSELYEVSENHKIVAGNYKKIKKETKFDKLNLGQINIFLNDKKIIKKNLFENIDKVRKLRNHQHLGTRKNVKDYSKRDLEFVFSVAKDIRNLFR